PLSAALCFLGMPVIMLVVTVEWQMVLKRQCIHVSFTYSLKNFFIGYFYGFITPGGFGAYLRAWYLKYESKAPLAKCVSNIITFNTLDYITLFLLGSIGGLFLLGNTPSLLVLIFILFISAVAVFVFFLRKRTSKHLFERLLRTQIFQFIQRYMDDSMESFFDDLPTFRSLLLPFLVSFLGWFVFFTELFLIAQLFAIHVPYVTFLFMLAIAATIATIPISLYGLGTRDATLVALLSLYQVPPENSVSFTLFWFMIFWVTPSLIGAVITIFESKKLPVRKKLV
ncbi:MAG TPA: lysylphosphatidylglycerol synthase transmembrane domain-containing protein, partial [Candidatus Thermoplasmatota archaeon]|nr:lysylphosphatidylglycerol synthase transmembrane domain-containing protein [Candidatus Thermoplasmatota archaeon]